MNYDIQPIQLDASSVANYARFLGEIFQKKSLFTNEYVDWLYNQNPDGKTIGFNAIAPDQQLAAHYVAQPLQAMVDGQLVKGLLSYNTATHPNHGGKGLFTKLAQATYDHAASLGYTFVVGVSNQNSTHGFIKKLGFQLVGPLDVKLGVGKINFALDQTYSYQRHWTNEALQWRLNHPSKQYFVKRYKKNYEVLIPAKPGLNVVLGNFDHSFTELEQRKSVFGMAKMWMGIDAKASWNRGVFVNLPDRLKPSPLNLIFKDLTSEKRQLDPTKIKFNVLDFDAF